MSNKHIVILNFDFPPNFGIGGRRWGKLAKGFAKKGIHVHVIKAVPKKGPSSTWSADVNSPLIESLSIPRRAELDRYHIGISIADKIFYRIALLMNTLRERGTPYDLAIGSRKDVFEALTKYISTFPIEWIFVTGAPFNFTFYAAEFVRDNPSLKLWVDFRDPWLNAKNYGMPGLNERRRAVEWNKAQLVLKTANFVSYPYMDAAKELAVLQESFDKQKLCELPHFYDPDDIVSIAAERSDNRIRLVYGGDIYPGSDNFLIEFASQLRGLKSENTQLFNQLDIRFYTAAYDKVNEIFNDLREVVSAQNSIGKAFFQEIASADWLIILLSDYNKDFFTTKYFEFIPFAKPILFIGPAGRVSKTIISEKLGVGTTQFFEWIGTEKARAFAENLREGKPIGSLDERITFILEKTGLLS